MSELIKQWLDTPVNEDYTMESTRIYISKLKREGFSKKEIYKQIYDQQGSLGMNETIEFVDKIDRLYFK